MVNEIPVIFSNYCSYKVKQLQEKQRNVTISSQFNEIARGAGVAG